MLLKEKIHEAVTILKSYGAKEVYAFGSAIEEKIHEDSDIDLAVRGLPDEVL